ncbi:hypothetical protein BPO_1298 [Bergeyella porcorum]|uniref:Uncharacterized protein n=1 Tax=Bergeyella porcorum TaxID=1735111 RepID=A0AAU0F1J0_9FLAO
MNAKENGISRVCLGAAWRNVKDGPEFEQVLDMVREVTKMDMGSLLYAGNAHRKPSQTTRRSRSLCL